MKWFEYLQNFGLLGMFICGIVIIVLIFTGNTYTLIQINTLTGLQYITKWNPVFDYSVLGVFSCLLIFSFAKLQEDTFTKQENHIEI